MHSSTLFKQLLTFTIVNLFLTEKLIGEILEKESSLVRKYFSVSQNLL